MWKNGNPQSLLLPIISIVGNVTQELFKIGRGAVRAIKESLISLSHNRLILNQSLNPVSERAVIQELKAHDIHSNSLVISDRGLAPDYNLPMGKYTVQDEKIGKVTYIVEDGKIIIEQMKLGSDSTIKDLTNYFDRINRTRNSPSVITKFFISNGGSWDPIFRQPRKLENLNKTTEMSQAIINIDYFISKEGKKEYENHGYAYRKGYLLYGPPGTGKTSLIEIVAQNYGMSVYMINFSANGMTDNVLIKLASIIPPKSILVFEEIDKQLKNLEHIDNRRLSIGGLLTAIDGPQRLSSGVLVILTANTNTFLSEDYQRALLRKGRIDESFHFMTKI